ncbi:hypothetical protein BJX70DRAFT_402409 [Aspergillus crustosus]
MTKNPTYLRIATTTTCSWLTIASFLWMILPNTTDCLFLRFVPTFESWVGPNPPDPARLRDRPDGQEVSSLVIDEEVMSALDAVESFGEEKPERISLEDVRGQWVKAVDAYPNLSDPGWHDGMIKVPIRCLWSFWRDLSQNMSMERLKDQNGLFWL